MTVPGVDAAGVTTAGPPGGDFVAPAALQGPWGLDALRQFGWVEAIRELLPAGADPAIIAVTQLGDVWLLLVALTLFVWYGSDHRGSEAPASSGARGARERRSGALAVAVALGGLALVVGLKALFALPRPPATYQAYHADGYGFPSGHALGSTVAWGAMAWLSSWSTRQRRVAAASVIVVAVGLSRVFLGVHYLGSVLAGFAAGVVFLGGTLLVARRDPLRAFAVAGAVALFAVAAGAVADGATVLGGVAGGALAWSRLDLDGAVHPVAAVAGLALFGGLWAAVEVVGPPVAVLFVANAAVVGGILSWPALLRTAEQRRATREPSG